VDLNNVIEISGEPANNLRGNSQSLKVILLLHVDAFGDVLTFHAEANKAKDGVNYPVLIYSRSYLCWGFWRFDLSNALLGTTAEQVKGDISLGLGKYLWRWK